MQAIIITAYKDFDYLGYLINSLDDEEIYIFIRVDSQVEDKSNIELLKHNNRIHVISTRKVIWGSIEHLNAILDLIRIAKSTGLDFNYYHIITGQDFMWKSLDDFKNYFSNDNKHNYISVNKADKSNEFRYKYYYRNDLVNYKKRIGNLFTKFCYMIQKIFLIHKRIPNNFVIYKGLVYVSITLDFTNYILNYIESKEGNDFMKFLKWSFIPEEFFFQTLIMNSSFKNTVVNNNKRFILWEEKHGTQPGILDIDDFEPIRKSDSFFIRKINLKYSNNLIKRIENEIRR